MPLYRVERGRDGRQVRWAAEDFVGRCEKRKEKGVGLRGGERRGGEWAAWVGWGWVLGFRFVLGLLGFFQILFNQFLKTFLNQNLLHLFHNFFHKLF
jgi:hypothetical protein